MLVVDSVDVVDLDDVTVVSQNPTAATTVMRDLRQLRLQSWGGVRKPTSGAVTCHWNRRGTDAAATLFYRPSGRRFERACVPYDDDDNRLLVLKTSSKTIEWIFVVFFLQEPNQD